MDTREQQAIRRDANQRIRTLTPIYERLLPDQDDPYVLSELCIIASQLRQAEAAVGDPAA